jgi:hypothetical protein
MKKLTWKKKKYDNILVWIADIKHVGWQFSIEEVDKNTYEAHIYYGQGEDCPLMKNVTYFDSLADAKKACSQWLNDLIVNLNKLG